MELEKLLKRSRRILIDDESKIVIMSDCHRGAGDNDDNFLKNKNIFKAALQHYYEQKFIDIELGDGDEMWEVQDYGEIIEENQDIFECLKRFYDEGRLFMIYGNHDIVKRNSKILKKYFYYYIDPKSQVKKPLFEGIEIYESLVLDYKGREIFLIHGHQKDFLNNNLWRLARFLVRRLWRVLERIGVTAPTGAAKNNEVTTRLEKKYREWSLANNTILIAGHTHRPVLPKPKDSLYFNDGSCVHPNGITCLEIENGMISLVKWSVGVTDDGILNVQRELLEGSEKIDDFYL